MRPLLPLPLALLLLVPLPGCGLFSTRDPENPVDSGTTPTLATTASEARTLLEQAISLRDPNLYMSVIAPSFAYAITPQAYPDNPSRFDQWSFNDEDNYIRTLLSSGVLPASAVASLTFTALQQQEEPDTVQTQQAYLFEVATTREDLPTTYEGIATLTIARGEDGGWRIVRWLDDASGESPTMSQLRAAL